MYKNTWEAAVGETLSCVRESRNARDRYAVAVEKNSTVVGPLSRKVSRVCALLLKRGGSIPCTVTGKRRYLADLPQGDRAVLPLVACNAVEPSSWIHVDAMIYKIHTLKRLRTYVTTCDTFLFALIIIRLYKFFVCLNFVV